MNIEELEQIKQDIKAVYNVMYNFDDRLCDDMQERVKRIETLLTAYEKEKEKNRILESKNIKLCDDNLELIKQNPYDKKLHYKYVETPKIEPQWYEKEE